MFESCQGHFVHTDSTRVESEAYVIEHSKQTFSAS